MGNISFIIPGKHTEGKDKGALNLKGFTIQNIAHLIENTFKDLDAEILPLGKGQGQLVISKGKDTVCEIWMQRGGCYLMSERGNPKEDSKETTKWYKKLNDLKLPISPRCIGISYGAGNLSTQRSQVIVYLLKYFKGYWMDEGIHPEFSTHTENWLKKYNIEKINELNEERAERKFNFSSAVPMDLQILYKEANERETYLQCHVKSKERDASLHENLLLIVRLQQLILPYLGKRKKR